MSPPYLAMVVTFWTSDPHLSPTILTVAIEPRSRYENGSIGCAVNGGEGEGEGEPECVEDSDCEEDEECDNGECESAGGGRDRGGDDVIEPAPLFACSSATPGAVGLSVVALALLRRRRR